MYVSKDVLPQIAEELKKVRSSFWGVLAILKSLNSTLHSSIVYQIDASKLSEIKKFLSELFYFGDESPNFSSNDSSYVIFSNNWISELKLFFVNDKINFYYIALWIFRYKELPVNCNLNLIKQMFIKEFNIDSEYETDFFSLFDFSIGSDINLFSEKGFSHDECFKFLKNIAKDKSNNLTYSVDRFIVAPPWELTRSSFIQPLYAGQSIQKCLIFSSLPLSKYYSFINNSTVEEDSLGIRLGMKSEFSKHGVVTVLDFDDYSYQIYCESESKHSKGIRTISKILLKEWIDAVTKFPDKKANTIRNELKWKSDIDKFEYGNEAILYKLAKMATGQASYSIVDVSEYKKRRPRDFTQLNIFTTKDVENLDISKLGQILKEMYQDEETKAVPSIHVFGIKYGGIIKKNGYKTKDIIKAANIKESYYSELDKALGTYEIIQSKCYNIAFEQFNPIFDSSCLDKLSIALNLFRNNRTDGWLDKGRNVNARQRLYYEKLTVDALTQFDEAKISEFFTGVKDGEGNTTFYPMWAGNIGSGWGNIQPENPEETKEIVDFLVGLKEKPRDFLGFSAKNFKHPKGFGNGVITELLMKLHPEEYFKHGRVTHNVFTYLGLIDFPHKVDYSDSEYKIICGEATKILEKMKEMKISRQILDDDSEDTDTAAPDYLTVNEFVWFVNENKDLIKEKIMAKKMKSEKPTKRPYQSRKTLSLNKDSNEDKLLLRLVSALRAKPFAILAGHSGTGKSRYVKKMAYMTCNVQELYNEGQLPGNYLLLQVKPNWHDSTDLLGFRNAMDGNKYQKTQLIEFLFKAYHYSETPFFLCLDEMNLAPVEQYFAEFLSAMESKEPVPLNDISGAEDNLYELGCEWTDAQEYLNEHGFSIPKNLFIVGTVNMDETTNQFSRKVLDRAFTLEMTDVDFTRFGCIEEPSYDDLIEENMIEALLEGKNEIVTKLDEEDIASEAALIKVQDSLKSTAFAIAYRFACEYTLLKRAIKIFDPNGFIGLDAFDQAVLMKILPRIAGEDIYIKNIYGESATDGLKGALQGKQDSLKKIDEIMKRAKDTGSQYITFWP